MCALVREEMRPGGAQAAWDHILKGGRSMCALARDGERPGGAQAAQDHILSGTRGLWEFEELFW